MNYVMSNFGNINYKIELEVKVSLLEKENFELRVQLIDHLLIIKQLECNSKSNPFNTDVSTTTNTITTPAQTNNNINSNNHINNNNNINNNNCKNKNNGNNNNQNKKNNGSTHEKAVYNEKLESQSQEIRMEEHTNFLNLKTNGE